MHFDVYLCMRCSDRGRAFDLLKECDTLKHLRHNAIREVVGTSSVTNQDELRRKLRRRGFEVTQATLSRDIRDLNLSKTAHGYALPQGADQQVVGELVLLWKAGGRDGLQSGKKGLVGLVAAEDCVEGVVGELVIVSVVAEGRGALGKVTKIGLVLLFEKRVLSGQAVGKRLEVLGKERAGYSDYQKQNPWKAHRCMESTRSDLRLHEEVGHGRGS